MMMMMMSVTKIHGCLFHVLWNYPMDFPTQKMCIILSEITTTISVIFCCPWFNKAKRCWMPWWVKRDWWFFVKIPEACVSDLGVCGFIYGLSLYPKFGYRYTMIYHMQTLNTLKTELLKVLKDSCSFSKGGNFTLKWRQWRCPLRVFVAVRNPAFLLSPTTVVYETPVLLGAFHGQEGNAKHANGSLVERLWWENNATKCMIFLQSQNSPKKIWENISPQWF